MFPLEVFDFGALRVQIPFKVYNVLSNPFLYQAGILKFYLRP